MSVSMPFDLSNHLKLECALGKAVETAPGYGFDVSALVSVRPAFWESLEIEEQWRAVFVRPAEDNVHELEFFQIWIHPDRVRTTRNFDLDFPQSSIEMGRYSLPWHGPLKVDIQTALSIGMEWFAAIKEIEVLRAVAVTFEQHGLLTMPHGERCWIVVAECDHANNISSWTCSINATTGIPITD